MRTLLGSFWADEQRQAQAIELLAQTALSFRAAAEQIGVTKNSLIGFAWRRGIRRRGPPTTTIIDRLPDLPDPKACRYPHGDPREPGFHFCGAPIAVPQAAYCPQHMLRCYQRRPADDR
jgi:GcrA cell cycle regulator